jgi:uncharacterized membrane protein YidH (DUF202 family)
MLVVLRKDDNSMSREMLNYIGIFLCVFSVFLSIVGFFSTIQLFNKRKDNKDLIYMIGIIFFLIIVLLVTAIAFLF